MLDIKFIRENAELVKAAVKNKNKKVDIDELLRIDEERRSLVGQIDELRARRNESVKNINNKPSDDQIREGKTLKDVIAKKEKEQEMINSKYDKLILEVPNIISKDTPIGPDESGNVILRKVGEPKEFDFKILDHSELGVIHNIIDTEKSAIISGPRFNYLFGEAVLLQFALLHFIFSILTDKNIISELAKKVGNPSTKPFTPVLPPVFAKAEVMKKMDRFDPIDDRYFFKDDNMLLVGSAEHTLGPIHMNQTLNQNDLPIRYIGYSTAFRREAGSYGKDTTGILRRHQFDKAEIEAFTAQEDGLVEQDFIVAIQEYLIQQLKIPYQVVAVCSGDMGKPDYRQIDIECWMPGQNKYRETNTSDYMTDFQSRRLNIKYLSSEGEKKYVHMNDATAFAMGRILIAIIENYQEADGSIIIPEVLRRFMPGNISMIKRVK